MTDAVCSICGATERLVRDHDHNTGEVRGWICPRCNVMLGYAADSQDRLQQAAAYLASTNRQPRAEPGQATPPKRGRAAYMREYRKRQRREVIMNTTMPAQAVRELIDAQDRIRDLESEVARLKRELAARAVAGPAFNSRPFTPAPKPGKH